MKMVRIGRHTVGENKPVFIIAEAGVNHNGTLALARELIDAAQEAGADAVKFQIFTPEELATADAKQAAYQKKSAKDSSQLSMLRRLALSHTHFIELKRYADKAGIMFLATPYGVSDADFLASLKVEAFKVASGDITNIPFLLHIAAKNRPVIVSTGMATLREIQDAVETLRKAAAKDIVLMQCTSEYPAPPEHANLRVIPALQKKFSVPVGLSDHTEGIAIPIAAAAIGACVIEKHFTLDRNLPGPDHRASLEPHELAAMIRNIRSVENALGTSKKTPTREELENAKVARKSIVSERVIQKGESFTLQNIVFKRPGTGIAPSRWKSIVGRRAARTIPRDHLISKRDIA